MDLIDIDQLRAALPRWLEDTENGSTDSFRMRLAGLAEDLWDQDEHIDLQHAKTDPVAKRLMTLRGVVTIMASALAGALIDYQAFKRGRSQ